LARLILQERLASGPLEASIQITLAETALELHRTALELRTDTLPSHFFSLAGLALAAEDVESAARYQESGEQLFVRMADPERERRPLASGNVPLARGELADALDIVGTLRVRRFIEVGEGPRIVPLGSAFESSMRAMVLGSLLVSGSPLRTELRRMESAWSGPLYTPGDRERLRIVTGRTLLVALVGDDRALLDWTEGLALDPDSDLAVARAVATDAPNARRRVEQVIAELAEEEDDTSRLLAVARMARRVGASDAALDLLRRIERIPARVVTLDTRWATRTAARLLRAELLSERGDDTAAEIEFRAFQRLWSGDGSALADMNALAQELRDRLIPDEDGS